MQLLETVELSALRAAQENWIELSESDEWKSRTAFISGIGKWNKNNRHRT